MILAANVVVALVALLHLYFLVLEMFLWNTPRGRRTFDLTPEFAAASRTLAANQGLYNGFLAAGLGVQVKSLSQFMITVPLPTIAGMSVDTLSMHADSGYAVVSGTIH